MASVEHLTVFFLSEPLSSFCFVFSLALFGIIKYAQTYLFRLCHAVGAHAVFFFLILKDRTLLRPKIQAKPQNKTCLE